MKRSAAAFASLVIVSCNLIAAEAEHAGPSITHAPVTTATRGIPVQLVCTIETVGLLTQTVAQIRVTDVGPPQSLPLKGQGEGGYEAIVPITLVEGIQAFWYSLSAYDEQGQVDSTHWQRVRIVEAAHAGGATPAWKKPIVWLGGAAIVAGGATAAILANDDDSGGDDEPPPPEPAGAPVTRTTSGSSAGGPPREEPQPPAPCFVTGNERVVYGNLGVYDPGPITIFVCGTCADATIAGVGSWNETDQIAGYNNANCVPVGQFLQLDKPPVIRGEPPLPGTYLISVFSNGILIGTRPWPDEEVGQPGA